MDTNTCDRCGIEVESERLIWITAEDFTPLTGEVVPEEIMAKHDALCESCYLAVLLSDEENTRKGNRT